MNCEMEAVMFFLLKKREKKDDIYKKTQPSLATLVEALPNTSPRV